MDLVGRERKSREKKNPETYYVDLLRDLIERNRGNTEDSRTRILSPGKRQILKPLRILFSFVALL